MKEARRSTHGENTTKQDLMEVWFAGVHCDVGGGYAPKLNGKYAELWREPFAWMLAEAKRAGLLLDESRLPHVLGETPDDPRPWSDLAHESLTKRWWLAEFLPKRVWDAQLKKSRWAIGGGRPRTVPSGVWIHRSVMERIRDQTLGYTPLNLLPGFVRKVRGLDSVPMKHEP
jgi:hypothetical protein